MRTAALFKWIKEREAIRVKHDANAPKPWTKDSIFQQYSFCNVHREDDRVTKWIALNWRADGMRRKDLWFWMVIARLVNRPDTLNLLQKPAEDWQGAATFTRILQRESAAKRKVFSGAYIVSTNGRAVDKAEYLATCVLQPLWGHRAAIRPQKNDSLASFYERLSGFNGMGSFLAGQVVADMKYVFPLRAATDWTDWAASGPGSRRGLNRVMGLDIKSRWKEDVWLSTLQKLAADLAPRLEQAGIERVHNQDLQNCLCEFDKYERTRLGEGRPRSTYPGKS